ncbi:hypothetical protein F7734_51180 [Scytonema sp. UIC 10036]|uniref:hypothetical protein n=1 Tax=Scytonema sp. UIC 10036 TaxID=2304196 RepID=UPI0012DA1E29|nr:hypothetical protein [Scytonema sp. UIC 10036]MUH00196.1 hypothetical protein [Scytonema sp. UIC 10036]
MLKRLLFLFSLTVTGTGAIFFFFWYQATQLPLWYNELQSQKANPPLAANVAPSSDRTEQLQKAQKQQAQKQVLHKISDHLKGSKAKGEVQLDAEEVNALIDSGIAQSSDKSRLAQAVVSTKTQIENGKISTGAVIDLRAIPFNELQKGEQVAVSKLLSVIPILRYHPVYVEVEGKPTLRNKQVSLDDTTRVKLGNISFSVLDLSKRFGFSEERLNQQVAKKLENLPVEVDEVEVVGDRLVVRGSAGNKKGARNNSREST